MDQYLVFGNPIAQSKSPIIHNMFAEQTGYELNYERMLASPEGFIEAIQHFFADENAKGCNITSPFKEQVAQWVTHLSEGAQVAGAVNTVIRQADGSFVGDTTDGVGLVQDLHRLGAVLEGANILLLGAGGAARGVLKPILEQAPNQLLVANRTKSKANTLASLIDDERLQSCGFDELENYSDGFDIIINSTSASLSNQLPPIADAVFTGTGFVYDMTYQDKPTVFLQHAQSLGVKYTFDGLGMLVGQAAESFYLWTGKRPDVEPVISALRASL